MSPEKSHQSRDIDWQQLIEEALNTPGDMQNVYDRFYPYSFLNQVYLRLQGYWPTGAQRQQG